MVSKACDIGQMSFNEDKEEKMLVSMSPIDLLVITKRKLIMS